jgi:hypothetical protein
MDFSGSVESNILGIMSVVTAEVLFRNTIELRNCVFKDKFKKKLKSRFNCIE